jgi:hypothetical protein
VLLSLRRQKQGLHSQRSHWLPKLQPPTVLTTYQARKEISPLSICPRFEDALTEQEFLIIGKRALLTHPAYIMTSDKTGKRICVIHLMTMPPPPNALDKTATPRPQLPTTFAAPSLRSVASSVTMVSQEDIIESSKEESSSSSSSHITTSPHALPSSTSPRAPLPALLAFTALNLAIFLVALDTVLIPTALPTIALSFHVPDPLYAWIGSAYLLANAASVPLWGKLSDIFGRKRVIITASCVFLAGSVVCAFSGDARTLVAGRAVQGLGGGGVVVLVHVCVSDLFAIR